VERELIDAILEFAEPKALTRGRGRAFMRSGVRTMHMVQNQRERAAGEITDDCGQHDETDRTERLERLDHPRLAE
jgi:hypothetical protein